MLIRVIHIFFIWSFWLSFSLHSQTAEIDSMISTLPDLLDSAKYIQLRTIVKELHNVDPQQSNKYAYQALELAKEMVDLRKQASCHSAIGLNHSILTNHDSAYYHLKLAVEGFVETGDTLQMILTLENLAIAYQTDNQPEMAIEIYVDVMKAADAFRDWEGMTTSRINVASLYIDQESYDRAIYHLKEIEKTYYEEEENDEARGIIEAYSPYMYINLGNAYRKIGKPDTALFYFRTCLKLSTEIGNSYVASFAYNNIGDHFSEEEQDYFTALEYHEKALEGFQALGDKPGIAETNSKIGNVHNHLGNLDTAFRYLIDAKEIAEPLDIKETLREIYRFLSWNAELRRDYEASLAYFQQYAAYKDSIFSENRDKVLQRMSRQFQTEKQEVEIARQEVEIALAEKQKTIQQIVFGISVLLIIALAFIFYSRYKLRQQRKVSEFTQKVNTAMARFVPNEFIRTLGKNHIMDVELGDQVEKVVTIVFTDIRSFTTISEGMTPKENFRFVKEYAERMGPIILKNGGFINQYLGDGLMAIFQNSAQAALNACIEMQESVKEFNKEQEANGQYPIRVGMGMHTGPLVMGIIGDDERRDVALISDTVNAAARLESITKEYRTPILMSEDSYLALDDKDKYFVRPLGNVFVKGKNIPMTIYECFNIDEEMTATLKQQTLPEFSNAVEAYNRKDYVMSQALFSDVLSKNPEDPVTASFVEKCRQILA